MLCADGWAVAKVPPIVEFLAMLSALRENGVYSPRRTTLEHYPITFGRVVTRCDRLKALYIYDAGAS